VGVPQAEGTAAASAYLFTAREYEAETGLAFHRARYNAPGMGRWLGPDPIGEMGGLNLYGYVGNRVTGAKDPLGLIILLRISFPFSEKLMRRSIPDISRTIIRGSGAVF
jgi:RHS repeat-associated protein